MKIYHVTTESGQWIAKPTTIVAYDNWSDTNQANPELIAIGFTESGEYTEGVNCEKVWQYYDNVNTDSWQDCENFDHRYFERDGWSTREILRYTGPQSKVEPREEETQIQKLHRESCERLGVPLGSSTQDMIKAWDRKNGMPWVDDTITPDSDQQPDLSIKQREESNLPQPSSESYVWYCPNCKEHVDGRNVTFSELHESCRTRVKAVKVGEVPVDESLLEQERINDLAEELIDYGIDSFEADGNRVTFESDILCDIIKTQLDTLGYKIVANTQPTPDTIDRKAVIEAIEKLCDDLTPYFMNGHFKNKFERELINLIKQPKGLTPEKRRKKKL